MDTWTLHSPTAQHLHGVGAALGALAPSGVCLALLGDLGAGKTTLTQGIGAGLGLDGPVTSPTFGLMVEHDGPCPLLHVDAYRLAPGEAEGIGLEETLEGWPGLAVVEWADLVVQLLPADCVLVRIQHAARGRAVQVWASSDVGWAVVDRWRAAHG